MSYDQIGFKGHDGITGVKNVILTENASPAVYIAWSRDSYILISLTAPNKTASENSPGVIWAHWDQKLDLHGKCYASS